MSVTGGTLNVGTLAAKFSIDASGAQSQINTINQQANAIKNAFGNVTFKLDASQSQSAIQQLTTATTAYKAAQTQATQALADQRTALTASKTALDAQKTATEAARTAAAQATADLKQLQLATKATADEAKNAGTAFSGLQNVLAGMARQLGRDLFDTLVSGIHGVIDGIIGMNGQLQQSQMSFTALTGSVQTGNALLQQTEAIAAHSTFGLNQIQNATQKYLAFGTAVGNIPALLVSAQNAAAASGGSAEEMANKYDRINYVLGELASGVPVTERQIRELASAGVDVSALAQQLGLTNDQLYNVGKTGQVTGQQIVQAFTQVYTTGNLGDFMQKQAQTFNGALQLIKTNVSLAIAQAFQPLFQIISDLAVKIAEFVQTPTFQRWAEEVRQAVSAAITLIRELGDVLAPVGKALAAFFGFDTGNIGAEMEAAANSKPDVAPYDPTLGGDSAGGAGKSGKPKMSQDDVNALANYTRAADGATAALIPFNEQLDRNKTTLDGIKQSTDAIKGYFDPTIQASDAAIKAIKGYFDPTIQASDQAIARINQLSPAETARKQRELTLDTQKADLELTKPDTSSYDDAILKARTALAQMPDLDTSFFEGKIKADEKAIQNFDPTTYTKQYTDKIKQAQDDMAALDPEAATSGFTQQIQDLQDHMASLNTDEVTAKIDALKDKLNEPPPNTAGLTNQLKALEAQLHTGAISQADFDRQYGAISAAKNTINTDYEQSRSADTTQLKSLEGQKREQDLANREAKQADEEKIRDLTRQSNAVKEQIADKRKDYEATIRENETLRQQAQAQADRDKKKIEDDRQHWQDQKTAAEEADRTQRKSYEDTIKQQGILKENALAEYNAKMKSIDAQIQQNKLLDAAAAAHRAVDRAPYEQARDAAKSAETTALAPYEQARTAAQEAEQTALAPFEKAKTVIDEQNASLREQVTHFDDVKRTAEAAAKAIKDAYLPGGDKADTGAPKGGGSGGTGLQPIPQGSGLPDSPLVRLMKGTKDAIEQLVNGDAWKRFWSPDTSLWDKAQILLQGSFDLVGKLDGAIKQFIGDHVSGIWYELIFGKTKAPGGVGPDAPVDLGQQVNDMLDGMLTAFDGWLRAHDVPVSWTDWWNAIKAEMGMSSHAAPGGVGPPSPGGLDEALDDMLTDFDNWCQSHGVPVSWQDYWNRIKAVAKGGADPTEPLDDGRNGFDRWLHQQGVPVTWTDWWNDLKNAIDLVGKIGDALDKGLQGFDTFMKSQGIPVTWTDWWNDAGNAIDLAKKISGQLDAMVAGMDAWVASHVIPQSWQKWWSDFGKAASNGIESGLQAGLDKINGLGQGVVTALNNIAKFFKGANSPDAFSWTNISIGTGTRSAADNPANMADGPNTPIPTGGAGGNAIASGTPHWRGGAAWIGEAGRELYHDGNGWQLASAPTATYLPRGTTVLPNAVTEQVLGGLPHFAGGLFGDVLGGVQSLAGDALALVRQGANAVYDHTVGSLGQASGDGAWGTIANDMAGWAKEQMLAGIRDTIGRIPGAAGSLGAISGLAGAGTQGLLAAIRAVTGDPREQLAMLLGVATEWSGNLSGPWGSNYAGSGAEGPWQLMIGAGGSFAGVSKADADNPATAARLIKPDYDYGMSFAGADQWQSNLRGALETVVLNAERPGSYPQTLRDAGWNAIQPYINGSGLTAASSGATGAGWPSVVAAALQMSADPNVNGPQWNNYCEKFAEAAERAAGFTEGYWDTALAHGTGVAHQPGWGPPGSMQHWGAGYWPVYGHAAINLDGQGQVIGTSPNGIAQYSMAGAPDNLGWLAPGLAAGAYVTGPTNAWVGEGGVPEFVLPEPKLNAALVAAVQGGRGGGNTIYLTQHVHPTQGMDEERLAALATAKAQEVFDAGIMGAGVYR